ncbi:MAG: DUF3662 domain-containing protein [Pyrinomonadaceae bacterium]|nr:DUF3662 domain-containing protein [Pyrinomonadaceae bacterium]
MSVLDKVRRWIDGESAELVLEEAARDAQIKPRSQAEEFIVKIAREVEDVMQKEMVPLPQGTTLIPTEYIIFLSEEDDKDWQGAKRRGLEQGLHHILAERARELAGKKKLKTKSFAIELRVDGTLDAGDLLVQHGWDEPQNPSGNTQILSRPRQTPPAGAPPRQMPPQQDYDQSIPPPPVPNFSDGQQIVPNPSSPNLRDSLHDAPPPILSEAEEMTHVNSRTAALYNLEVWRGGVRQNVVPIFRHEIVIGRGSKSKPVDIALADDPEISRRHLLIILDRTGQYSVINEGRNPTVLNNVELPIGQRVSVNPGQSLNICTYMVRIQPR